MRAVETGFDSRWGARGLLHNTQTGSTSHPVDTKERFPGRKSVGEWSDHSSAEVKIGGDMPPFSHTSLCVMLN
jgi:hypothetical protein